MLENYLNKITIWMWSQKDWLFDGIGTMLLEVVAIPVLICTLIFFKKKFFSVKKNTSQDSITNSNLPAFDLESSQARITRSSIIGNVPSGFVRATNGSSIDFTDSIIVNDQNYVDFPEPSELYRNKTPEELKLIANEISVKLFEFDSQVSNDLDNLNRNEDFTSEKYSTLSSTHNSQFNQYLRANALAVMSEILNRLEPIHRQSLAIETRCGIDAALHGRLTGAHSARGLANFLNFIAEKLAV